jgi:NADPH:quinone reductase-like Zn-dependent oxidoreductase
MREEIVMSDMHAVRLHHRAGPEQLVFEAAPRPIPYADDVLVEVNAAGITPSELTWDSAFVGADGRSRLPAIPSHEVSGVVAAVGEDTAGLAVGDAVYGLTDFCRDGAAAEFQLVRSSELAPKPASLDHVHAAAIPLSGLTAWQALHDHGRLSEGQRVLVHGGAGGVGNFVVQLARIAGAEVIATAAAADRDFLRAIGADEILDYRAEPFDERVREIDLVVDTVGGNVLERSFEVTRRGGTIVSLVEPPDSRLAAEHEVRTAFFVVEPNRDQLIALAELADQGRLRAEVMEVFELASARDAIETGLRDHVRGKLVLRVVRDEAAAA